QMCDQETTTVAFLARYQSYNSILHVRQAANFVWVASGHDQALFAPGPLDKHHVKVSQGTPGNGPVIISRVWIKDVQTAAQHARIGKALQAVEAAVEHGGKLTARFPHAPFEQWIVAATHNGWPVESGAEVAAAFTVLHHPQVNEHLGKEPLPSHTAAGNPACTDEFV